MSSAIPVAPTPAPTPTPTPAPTPTQTSTPILDPSITPNPPHPAATALAGSLDKLNTAGMGGVDPNALIAVAQGPTQSSRFPEIVKALSDSVKQAKVPFVSVYHEASQHLIPTVSDYIYSTVNGTNNHLSAMDPQVLSIQKKLQSLGYGVNLPANSVWSMGSGDNAWSQALWSYNSDQLTKPGIGATSAKGFFSRIAHDVDPRYSLPALMRGVMSIIPATQKLVADTASKLGNAMSFQDPTTNPYTASGGARMAYFMQHGSMPNDFQAMDEQRQIYGGNTAEGLKSLAGDAGTAINLLFLKGMGSSLVGGVSRGITEAATAGGGNVAEGMVTNLGTEAAQRNSVNMMNALVLKPLAGAAKAAAGLGKVGAMVVSPAEALSNLPELKQIFPYIDSLHQAADGGWQSLRQMLRIPYQFPIVRTLAPLFPKAVFAGGVEQEMAHAQHQIDPTNPLATSMDHLTPIAGTWGQALLASQFLLHAGYDEAGKLATMVGKGFTQAFGGLSKSVDDQSLISQWERATGAKFGPTNQSLIDAGFPESHLTQSLAQQAQEAAVSHAANLQVDRVSREASNSAKPLSTGDLMDERLKQVSKIWDEAYAGDPSKLNQAQLDFSLVKNGFQAHVMNSRVGEAAKLAVSPSQGIVNYNLAMDVARKKILTDAHNLITPASRELYNGASGSVNQLGQPWDQASAPWHPLTPEETAPITKPQLNRIMSLMRQKDLGDRNEALAYVSKVVGRTVDSRKDLNGYEAKKVIDSFKPKQIAPSVSEPWATPTNAILHNFAIMKKTSLTSDELRAMVEKTVKSTQDEDTLHTKLADIAFNKLGVSTASLVGKDANQIADWLGEQASRLPANVYPSGTFDEYQNTSDAARAGLEEMDRLGYKLGYGTHTGHALVDPIIPPPEVTAKEGILAKTLGNMGLNLTKTSDQTYGQLKNSGMLLHLQKYFDKGEFSSFPPGYGPSETMHYLQREIDKTLTPVEKVFGKYGTLHPEHPITQAIAKAVSAGRWSDAIDKMMERDGINLEEAKIRIQQLQAQQKSSNDWTQAQVVNALLKPYLKDSKGNLDEALASHLGVRPDEPFTNSNDAIKFYRQMQEGNRKMPARLQGIGKFTDLLDNQFGLMGIPMGSSAYRLPNVTAELKNRLLKFRYPLNIEFAWKRVVKAGIKGSTIGITPTANAGDAMRAAGTYDQDMALLRHYKPEEFGTKTMDDALREAETADLYNVFNPQEIQARTLGILHRRAVSDPANLSFTKEPIYKTDSGVDATTGEPFNNYSQVGEKTTSAQLNPTAEQKMLKDLSSVYDYGDRSALERSTNAIFFPFSFEKTVIRQLGMHLLDHQGQALLGAAAVDFYDSHNGAAAKKWAEDNLPMIKELEKFYPYNSSFGVGAFGGIDRVMLEPFARAVLQMFSPKVIQGSNGQLALKTLINAVPMIKTANTLFGGYDTSGKIPFNPGGDFKTTVNTSLWYMNSKLNSWLGHSQPGLLDPHPQQPYREQITNGFDLETQLVSLYADELKANHNGASWSFPDKMPYVGRVGDLPSQKITMNAIKTIVTNVYPQWDKNKGLDLVQITQDQEAKMQRDIATKQPALLSDYNFFVKNASYVVKALQNDTLKEGQVANYTQILRNKAVELAAMDRDFAAFYKKYFATKFGPLEAIRP